MTTELRPPQLHASLTQIITEIVAPAAASVDAKGEFPQASVNALAQSGVLGIMSAKEHAGAGGTLLDAAKVVRSLAASCGSTAMITCMHYCGTAVYEAFGPPKIRSAIAQGKHLTTLSFSEAGSRSHFWAPVGTAKASGDKVQLDAHKSWVTSAHHADSYVWSSKSLDGSGVSLWHVPRSSPGLKIHSGFDGLGFRGNDSVPVQGEKVQVAAQDLLGKDGAGFEAMMQVVLPHFNVLIASCALGLMDKALSESIAHLSGTRYQHQDTRLCDFPTLRAYLARAQIRRDQCSALWEQSIAAILQPSETTMLRVLECKAAAAEAAMEVTSTCMRVCGGAAYRKEVGIERAFRDAQAASVMGPTSDVLYDFIGKALCNMPLF